MMRKHLVLLGALCALFYWVNPAQAQHTVNPSSVLYSTSSDSTGQPVAVSPQNALPSNIAAVNGTTITSGMVPTASLATNSIIGAVSLARIQSAASNNSTLVFAGSGNLYGTPVGNNNAAIRYLKLYDKATAPTCGTDTPIATLPLGASGGYAPVLPGPISVTLGLGYCLVTGAADSDNTSVGANDVTGTLQYKGP